MRGAIGRDVEEVVGPAEIMAQREQLAQTRPGLGRLPIRPQQRANLIAANWLAVGQGKAGQQSNTLARPDRNRLACQSLKFGRAKEMKPVSHHEICSDIGALDPFFGRIDFNLAELTPH
jgi:hypothetical protein